MWDLVLNTVAGGTAGIVGSLVTPWANWGIERARFRQQSRSQLIREAREFLTNPPPNTAFRHHPLYSRLAPHLSAKARDRVESGGENMITIVAGDGRHSGVNPYAQRVLDELCELERRWKLI